MGLLAPPSRSDGVIPSTPPDTSEIQHPHNGDPREQDAPETPVRADSRASGGWVSGQGRIGVIEALTEPYSGPWVDVVFIQDWHNQDGAPELGELGAMLEWMGEWDYGQETDYAHTTDTPQWGSSDTLYRVGQYVIAINYRLGYASLNRRPMGTVVTR